MIDDKVREVRILAVDDEEPILGLYFETLSPEEDGKQKIFPTTPQVESLSKEIIGPEYIKFELTGATQGEQAVEEVRKSLEENNPFSIVFMDVRMPPGQDGITTAEQIRELDPHVELVIVSAYTDQNPSELSKRIPPASKLLFIQKPFHTHEILQFSTALSSKWLVERDLRQIHSDLENLIEIRTFELEELNNQLKSEISKQKEVEEVLKSSEAKFRALAETTSAAVYIFQDKLIKYVNSAAESISGYRREEMVGKEYLKFVHPEFQKIGGKPI